MPNLGSSANFGTIEVSRAPETTDTALTPLTCSSAVELHAPRSIWFFVQLPREASNSQGNLPTDSQIQNITGARSCLFARSRQRFQGSVSGVSGPSLRSGRVHF